MRNGTIALVVIAALAGGWAYSSRPHELPPATFEDTGEALFPEFSDPTLATFLEVVRWDEEAASVVSFSVEQKEGRWVIPSHNDYPADGTERMGKAAASFIDINKDIYYGDNADDHAAFGVLDPTGADGKDDEKGQRITIKDASGTIFVDVIVGKQVPDKQNTYYVRYPEEKRVYGSRLTLDISTDFTDWIEKDLLHVERTEVVKLHYDPYVVDEEQKRVTGSDPIVADLKDVDGKEEWVADPATNIPKDKQLDNMKARQIVTAIDNVKIVGVRPRPTPLTPMSLQSKGFFVTQDGRRLFGNEGQASVITKDGLVYTLYFGEVTFESGLALTAGTKDGEEKKPEEGEEGDAKKANRYMFVDILYDPSLDTDAGGGDAVSLDEEPQEPSAEDREKQIKGSNAR